MTLLAETIPASAGLIQRWMHELAHFDELRQMVNLVYLPFVYFGVFLLALGYLVHLCSGDVSHATLRMVAVFLGIVCVPWWLGLAESMVGALVHAVVNASPHLAWIVAADPSDQAVGITFGQPYQVIGQYLRGKFPDPGSPSWWEISKYGDYLLRALFVFLIGAVASVTVFLMEALLVLQRMVLILSKLFLPVFVGCLNLSVMRGAAVSFLQGLTAVIAWPLGIAVGHLGTMAVLSHLTPPPFNASIGTLFFSLVDLGVVCALMLVVTFAGPALIQATVMRGGGFAQGLAGKFTHMAEQHTKNAAQATGMVAGATLGGVAGGAAGAAVGGGLGQKAGGMVAEPAGAFSRMAQEATESSHVVPDSRSREAGKMAAKAIGKVLDH